MPTPLSDQIHKISSQLTERNIIMGSLKKALKISLGITVAVTVFGWQSMATAKKTPEYQPVPLRLNAA